jgi:ligand-binding SRPBCC domain-containing protein
MRRQFQTEQWVPYSRERVFAFFANPENLPRLMPKWQCTRIEKMQLSAEYAGTGSIILISFRPVPLVPLRLRWEAYIAEFARNDYFCDEQRKGPFRYFRHCHRVVADVRGGVNGATVQDVVEYDGPLGVPGWAMKRQIAALFAHRQKMLSKLLATT